MDLYLTFKYYGMDQHLYWEPVWLTHENVLWFPCSFAHIIKILTLLWWNRILILHLANLCVQRIYVSLSDDRVCWMSVNLPVSCLLNLRCFLNVRSICRLDGSYRYHILVEENPINMYTVNISYIYSMRYQLIQYTLYRILYTVYTIVCVNYNIFWLCGRTVKSSFLGTTPLTISYTKLWIRLTTIDTMIIYIFHSPTTFLLIRCNFTFVTNDLFQCNIVTYV